MSTPVMILKSSPATWLKLPVPDDARLILPGLALAKAMNSGTDLTRHCGIHLHDAGSAYESGHRRDIADEIERELVVERGVDRVGRGDPEQRVAVGRGAHHHFGGNVGIGARPVLDHDRLAEPLSQPLAQEA